MSDLAPGGGDIKLLLNAFGWTVRTAHAALRVDDSLGWKTCLHSFLDVHAEQIRPPARSSRFLNYDTGFLRGKYRQESLVAGSLPYVELISFLDQKGAFKKPSFRLVCADDEFRLAKFGRSPIDQVLTEGYFQRMAGGAITHDSNVIRLSHICRDGRYVELHLQKAKYSDQVASNLLADYVSAAFTPSDNLRDALRHECGERLPELSDRRLANTIGVAATLMYLDNGNWTPLLMPRTPKSRDGVAVFEGGWHCSASGAAEWNDVANPQFSTMIEDDIYREIEEEIGLHRNEIYNFIPVSICRELARIGKPQIFFAGFVNLNHDQIMDRIDGARRKAVSKGKNVEVMEYPIFSFGRRSSTNRLFSDLTRRKDLTRISDPTHIRMGMTTEGAASLYYSSLAFPFLRDLDT